MAQRGRHNLLAVTVIVMAVSISLIAASYYIMSKESLPELTHTRSFTFYLSVVPSGTGNYTVRLPLVVSSNATPTPDAVNQMILSSIHGGQGKIVSTGNGYALEIEASATIHIFVTFTKQVNSSVPVDYYKLSMCSVQCGESNNNFDYHAYLQSTNITSLSVDEELTINESRAYGGSVSFLCAGTLTEGWHLLDGSYVVAPGELP